MAFSEKKKNYLIPLHISFQFYFVFVIHYFKSAPFLNKIFGFCPPLTIILFMSFKKSDKSCNQNNLIWINLSSGPLKFPNQVISEYKEVWHESTTTL